MPRIENEVKALGKKTNYNFDYDPNLLERCDNHNKENDYFPLLKGINR